MKILVVGSGGREHALVWKLAQSPRVREIFCAPGNAGTQAEATNVPIDPLDLRALLAFAKKEQIDLTVVGPEAPLVHGIVDAFTAQDLRIFGPSRDAAQLEGSKVFAKELMRQAGIPTAEFRVFRSAPDAQVYAESREDQMVVKADGLAAGKGVILCPTPRHGVAAVERIMVRKEFGRAGDRVLIEEKLDGQEVSIMALTDGRTILPLETARDYKRANDGDQGPNTGGMGSYSPAPPLSEELMTQIEEQILVPTVHAMKRRRRPFRGVLYAGLMLTNQGPRVLEFNVRFGDPETQPLMLRLKTDLVELLDAVIDGRLDEVAIEWDPRPAVCVVMAAQGYPGAYTKGHQIHGLSDAKVLPNTKIFHAGTLLRHNRTITDGGRVLGVTALGVDQAAARSAAYRAAELIRFPGAWSRRDIAYAPEAAEEFRGGGRAGVPDPE